VRRLFAGGASALLALALLGAGCDASVDDRAALEEPVRVGYFIGSNAYRAQFFPGELPAPGVGPAVVGVDIGPNQAIPGKQGKSGYVVRMGGQAFAVAVRLQGRANGYWIARVDQPEPLYGDQVSASLFFDVAPTLTPGKVQLELSGVDGSRQFGARSLAPLAVVPRIDPATPVVIQLRWDAGVDLDLQLRAPDGTTLTPKHPTTAPPGTADAGAAPGIGRLDGDSMAGCVDDGLREEDVLFATAPAPGNYSIYVNAFDLCGKVGANYEVSVIRSGVIGERFFGRISSAEVQAGGFGVGDFVSDITF
jgi:hypothetical protein